MTCSGAYAEAWEYAAFWCDGSMIMGVDNGGGAGLVMLTDNTVDFQNLGLQANVGHELQNLTTGLSGPITAVTNTTVTATGVTWTNGDLYRGVALTTSQKAQIDYLLLMTAGDIYAALSAVGGCDCTMSAHGLAFLAKINIIEAGVFHRCPCGRPQLTDEERAAYMDWLNGPEGQLSLLRKGIIEVCDGYTGAEYPAFGNIERGVSIFAKADIIKNRIARTGS